MDTRPLRILHVIHSLDPRSGGPSHALRSMIHEQVRVGHEVSVLATTAQSAEPWEPSKDYADRMTADPAFAGAEVHLGRSFGRRRPWSRYAFSPDCSRWLRRRLCERSHRPDVVHIHGIFSHVTSVAAKAARSEGIAYVLRLAGTLDAECLDMGSRCLKAAFTQVILRRDLQRAAYLQAMSEFEARHLCPWGSREQIRVVPHGIDFPECERTETSKALRSRHPNLAGRRVLLFMSRVAPKKRPELVVEALTLLHSDHSDLLFLVAGQDAGQMAVLQKCVRNHALEDSVVFAGFLQGDEKREAFDVADVFVLPSIDENFSVAVVEAMAHGVPVVVTPGVATHVYVDQSGGGLTVDGTAEALAAGIRRVLSGDPKAMGRRGRQFVERHLTWPAVVKQLDRLYEDALASRAR